MFSMKKKNKKNNVTNDLVVVGEEKNAAAAALFFQSDSSPALNQIPDPQNPLNAVPVMKGSVAVFQEHPTRSVSLSAAFDEPVTRSVASPAASSLSNPGGNMDMFADQHLFGKSSMTSHKNNNNDGLSMLYSKPQTQSQLDIRPPVAMFGYLEPRYHVFTNRSGQECMRAIKEVLDVVQASFLNDSSSGHRVDYQMISFRFQCSAYSPAGGRQVPFVISVFSLEDRRDLAIEFQRRKGCPIRFCAVYKALLAGLAERDVIAQPLEETVAPAILLTPPPLTGFPESQKDDITMPLLSMLDSKFVDVQTEAAEALAEWSASNDFTTTNDLTVPTLCRSMQSKDPSVKRCSISAMANLAKQCNKDECLKMAQQSIACNAVNISSQSQCSQTRRESARLLANMASTLGCDLFAHNVPDNLTAKLEQLSRSGDREVINCAETVLNCVGPV